MEERLVDFVLYYVGEVEIKRTYSQMCIEKRNLPTQNWELYNYIKNLVDDFVEDNDLSNDWFETKIGLIEDLFEELLKKI